MQMVEKDSKEILLTKEGLQKLEDELEYLKSTKREELGERLKQAIAFGDLSENSEYEDAKQEQAFVEGRIIQLEQTLRYARLMDDSAANANIVSLGSRAFIKEKKSGREIELMLVDSLEANLKEKKISKDSPVGQAILGQEVGKTVKVDAPSGVLEYEIMKVERA